jgi:hypothetical protein
MFTNSVGYEEKQLANTFEDHSGGRVALSECLERGGLGSRHLAMLFQLWLQEAGLPSTLVHGVLKLFSVKVRHAWNVVWFSRSCALVDVALSGRKGEAYVVMGASLPGVYAKAEGAQRAYERIACRNTDPTIRLQS